MLKLVASQTAEHYTRQKPDHQEASLISGPRFLLRGLHDGRASAWAEITQSNKAGRPVRLLRRGLGRWLVRRKEVRQH